MPRASVIVDPEDVRRFASILKESAGGLREKKTALNTNFKQLKEVWRDKKYSQFEQIYLKTLTHIERFTKEGDDCVRFLLRKADLADRYLRHRY